MTEQPEQDQGLSEVLDAPLTVHLKGKEYELHQLTLNDFKTAEAFIRGERIDALLDSTRMVPLPDAVRALSLAEIICRPILLEEVLLTKSNQLILIWLSLKQGLPQLKFEAVAKNIDPCSAAILATIVYQITGILRLEDIKARGEDEAPLDQKDSTSTSLDETPSIGSETPQTFATGTG